MDLKHAKTFVAVADLGTVSLAALQLRVAQPALSRRIAELEREFGLKLFDRVGRRLVLTGGGEQLLADCRALLTSAEAVAERARALNTGGAGVLKVVGSPQIIEGAVAEFLPRYARRFPAVQVKLSAAIGWSETAAMLERGEIHLGINLMRATLPEDQRFSSVPLAPIDLLAASGPSHDFGSKGSIEIAQLAGHPLLVLETSYVFRRNFDAACRLAGISPNIVYESRTPHTLLVMAESGHGVAIIPSAMRTKGRPLRLAAITYRGKRLREHSTIYWDRRRSLPAYATAFCRMLGERMRETFPISGPTAELAARKRKGSV
ncbi:MAG: LysR family transcriptional regulator [Hyphomicrobiales bacterium]|nr:MAG: LysR family transcriptional regulator [Hyphomicrobiales bacterium]